METFINLGDDKIDLLIQNSMVQNIIDKILDNKCIKRKKFKKLINELINKVSLLPFSKYFVKILINDRKIDDMYNKIIAKKIKKGKKKRICKTDIEKILKNICKKFLG